MAGATSICEGGKKKLLKQARHSPKMRMLRRAEGSTERPWLEVEIRNPAKSQLLLEPEVITPEL